MEMTINVIEAVTAILEPFCIMKPEAARIIAGDVILCNDVTYIERIINNGSKLLGELSIPAETVVPAIVRVLDDSGKEKIEELVACMQECRPHGRDPSESLKVYESIWSALCHNTDRAACFYIDDTPYAKLYHNMYRVFYKFRGF